MRRRAAPPFDEPADFVLSTPHNMHFHVSAALLRLASPYFAALTRSPAYRGAPAPFVLDVPESDAALETVLRLTYPVPAPVLHDLHDLADALAAAQKYELRAAQAALRAMLLLPRFVAREPLRVYALARRFGLDAEANAAAVHACRTPVRDWPVCEELDDITGRQYYDLLAFQRARGAAAVRLLRAAQLSACKNQTCPIACWVPAYRARAEEALLAAPTSDTVFSIRFVAHEFLDELDELGREPDECWACGHLHPLELLAPEESLSKLRDAIDSLPITVVPGKLRPLP